MKKSECDLENWSLFLKAYNKILRKIKADLKASDLPSLDVYDVLWTLEREENKKLRLQELGEKIDLEKYSVTRLIDKMVEDKLVTKAHCNLDKRGTYAVLTDKGLKHRQQIWNVYKKSIQEHFGENLSSQESSDLAEILKALHKNLCKES